MKKLIVLMSLYLAGCGDLYRDSAVAYAKAATSSLVKEDICHSENECTQEGHIFWEGASPLGNKVHINLYRVKGKREIIAVQEAILSARKNQDAGVVFTAYASKHGAQKVKLFESSLE